MHLQMLVHFLLLSLSSQLSQVRSPFQLRIFMSRLEETWEKWVLMALEGSIRGRESSKRPRIPVL